MFVVNDHRGNEIRCKMYTQFEEVRQDAFQRMMFVYLLKREAVKVLWAQIFERASIAGDYVAHHIKNILKFHPFWHFLRSQIAIPSLRKYFQHSSTKRV